MNTSQTKSKGAPQRTRLQVVEWSVDTLFTVEVRTGCVPGAPFNPEGIRYVKLAPGIPDHRAPGGSAGF